MYSQEELITQLRTCGLGLGRRPTQQDIGGRYPSRAAYEHHFGSWANALRAAGFQPRIHQVAKWSQSELIKQLQRKAKEIGRVPIAKDFRQADQSAGCTTSRTMIDHFGTWCNALRAAGMNSSYEGYNQPAEKRKRIASSNKGQKRSIETRLRISSALGGRKQSLETRRKRSKSLRGRPSPQKGKPRTDEEKRKIAETMRRNLPKGKDHWAYVHGNGRAPYSLDFSFTLKEEIRKRDNRTCQLCRRFWSSGRRFPVHHIDCDRTNNEATNLITLCNSCNAKVNTNRDLWAFYFKGLQAMDYERMGLVLKNGSSGL